MEDFKNNLSSNLNLNYNLIKKNQSYQNSFKRSASGNQYKNPWTSISRPMNGFIDIRQEEYESNETRKAQLAADLKK